MSLPSTITLTQPTTDSPATSADQRSDHTAIQTAVNGIIGYLASLSFGGVTGHVAANGSIVAGSNFSVVHSSTGRYAVTFSPTLSTVPVVLVTVVDSANPFISMVSAPTTSGFNLQINNIAGSAEDHAFNFATVAIA